MEHVQYAALAARLALGCYGRVPALTYVPSDESKVFVLRFADAMADRVLKAQLPDRHNVEREIAAFPPLRAHGVPVPEVDAAWMPGAETPVAVQLMRRAPGQPLHGLQDAPQRMGAATFRRWGALAAAIQQLPAAAVQPVHRDDDRWLTAWRAGERALCARALGSWPRWPQALDDAEAVRAQAPWAFCHGQGVQVLTDGERETIVDWGGCRMATRMTDLADMLQGSLRLWGRERGAAVRAWTLEGYRARAPLGDDALAELRALERANAVIAAARYIESGRVDAARELLGWAADPEG